MTKSPPAFQFYPKDFLADANVQAMSGAARGAYIMLLCHCWIEGSLPDENKELARLSGDARNWGKVRNSVMKCFDRVPVNNSRGYKNEPQNNSRGHNGKGHKRAQIGHASGTHYWTHGRLDRERQKQEQFKALQSVKGKRGAKKRWGKDSRGHLPAIAQAIPKDSSSNYVGKEEVPYGTSSSLPVPVAITKPTDEALPPKPPVEPPALKGAVDLRKMPDPTKEENDTRDKLRRQIESLEEPEESIDDLLKGDKKE